MVPEGATLTTDYHHPKESTRDKWALAFAAYFVIVIPASFVLALWLRSATLFLGAILLHAAVTIFIAWRRGDL